MAEQTRKRRRGDRKDAWLVRDLDGMHKLMPYILLNRTDNEAVMTEEIDATALLQWLAEKNANETEFKYTLFHAVLAALTKTICERPLMNRFIANRNYYDRKEISYSFVVKKQKEDHAYEATCILKMDPDDERSMIEQVHQKIKKFVFSVRRENVQDDTGSMIDTIMNLPRPLPGLVLAILRFLDRHGKVPAVIADVDPFRSTAYVSNLGSIGMNAQYHHLANWSTNSLFIIIGKKYLKRIDHADGTFELREMLPLSITVDERIADGVYFNNSVRVLRNLLENPELMDKRLNED